MAKWLSVCLRTKWLWVRILLQPLFQIADSIQKISSFLGHHLKLIAQKVNSFLKDTNHFLRKIKSLGHLPEGAILYTIDVVGLYPNISHEEGLASLRRFLDARTEEKVINETLVELAEIVLKNIFQFNQKTLKTVKRYSNWH